MFCQKAYFQLNVTNLLLLPSQCLLITMVAARILVSSMLVQMMTLSFLGGAEPAAVTAQVLPTLSEHH